MSLGDWFKRLFSTPEAAEDDADLREEYGVADYREAEVEQAGDTAGGAPFPGLAGEEAAEAAEADLKEFEAPPDPAP